MTDNDRSPDTVTAALIVIGEEILSGRTRDENISHIARYLNDIGIALQEVRVVRDIEAEIVAAVNELRARYSYVFTTGGIGPTHDDVTTDAIAKAFGVEVAIDPRAVEAMRQGYSALELTPARLRMARIPHGAELVDNPVSRAPGFMLGNVIVMAGIPRIMQVMLDAVAPRLKKGRPMLSRSVRIEAPEGDVAPGLAAIQAAHPDVQIGSYPFFEKGKLGTYVVLRSVEANALDHVLGALWELIAKEKLQSLLKARLRRSPKVLGLRRYFEALQASPFGDGQARELDAPAPFDTAVKPYVSTAAFFATLRRTPRLTAAVLAFLATTLPLNCLLRCCLLCYCHSASLLSGWLVEHSSYIHSSLRTHRIQ